MYSAYLDLFPCTAGGCDLGWGSGAGLARESAVLVYLGTEVVHIWFVIYFTPDFTAGHPSDLTADLARLRRGDEAWETGGRGGQRQPHTSLTDTCSTPDFA